MSDLSTTTNKRRFSLLELLMILMLVGIIFTFVIPMRQNRINREHVREAVYDMRIIRDANIAFREGPGDGFYAFDLGQLNIDHMLEQNYFNYTLTDSTITAVSTEEFAAEGAEIYYYLPAGPWMAAEDDLTRSHIDPNWLP